jgi:Ni/Fe-hydrogenase subunit HybB-like protein
MGAIFLMTYSRQRLEEVTVESMRRFSRRYIISVIILLALVITGFAAWIHQFQDGLYATGMRDRIPWGLYVTMFVFFIGASMGGTFVSAALRLADMGWRAPISRGAEYITVAALMTASLFIFADMGHPERAMNIMLFGRWESPLVWDVYGLTTYLAGSMVYLYLAVLPDLALVRDRIGDSLDPVRRLFVIMFSASWRGLPRQVTALNISLRVMTVVIVPVAVMMHTVTSWIFGMTLREPWDSPMFGIYFVVGAVYSGVGLIAVFMYIMRRMNHMEDFLTERHFLNMGKLLAGAGGVMIFFQISDLVTAGFKLKGDSALNLYQLADGDMAPIFWTYIWVGLMIPLALMLLPFTRNIAGVIVASILANVGMMLERYFIVIGGLRLPLNPYHPPTYTPSITEILIVVGLCSLFVLILLIMMKLAPAISVQEMIETGEIDAVQIDAQQALESEDAQEQPKEEVQGVTA